MDQLTLLGQGGGGYFSRHVTMYWTSKVFGRCNVMMELERHVFEVAFDFLMKLYRPMYV